LGELDETSGMHFLHAFIPESDTSLAVALCKIMLAPPLSGGSNSNDEKITF
jgi:hypothetical protein